VRLYQWSEGLYLDSAAGEGDPTGSRPSRDNAPSYNRGNVINDFFAKEKSLQGIRGSPAKKKRETEKQG
jgi:hypothetical protein